MNLAEELRRFETLSGEKVQMSAVGPSRHWSDLDAPGTVEPLPGDEALPAEASKTGSTPHRARLGGRRAAAHADAADLIGLVMAVTQGRSARPEGGGSVAPASRCARGWRTRTCCC